MLSDPTHILGNDATYEEANERYIQTLNALRHSLDENQLQDFIKYEAAADALRECLKKKIIEEMIKLNSLL